MTKLILSKKKLGFDSLGLISLIQKALFKKSYLRPTPIQSQAIPYLIQGHDLLGCAQTGTGKTGAFALPILQRLVKKQKPCSTGIFALILTPTRELSIQVSNSFRAYGRYLDVKHTVVYGGVGYRKQLKALSQGVDILIATPRNSF